jgi:hypothetical protein
MTISLRWLAPAVLAAGLGTTALLPAPARAQDQLTRVLVDIADVVINGGVPYYRHGHYASGDRLIAQRDRWGHVRYYRLVPVAPRVVYRDPYRDGYRYQRNYRTPPRGNAYGYWRNGPGARDGWCERYDRCVVHVERRDDWRRHDRDRHDRHDRHRHGNRHGRDD